MTDNVEIFPGATRLSIDADRVLSAAEGQLKDVLVLGYTKDGKEYLAMSSTDGRYNVWMLQRAIHKFMQFADD